ncbi:hypothetical protein ACO0LL_19990 [Undibacterium sp. TC4M20W]|uniref:hypothetical protein n=1 Tax=unclassified Undibacterium TaxID=2630295 RepID=UPI003BF3BF59
MPETQLPAILLIDDDAGLLQALLRLLSSLQHPLLSADNAREAQAIMAEHHVGVLICEPRDRAAADFLINTKEKHPDIVRLILTAYPDLDSVLRVVNQAHPFMVVTKPWLDEELQATVSLALKQYAVNRERERLLKEYNGILNNAGTAHAFRTLDALMYSIHKDMTADAIDNLPMGACLMVDGVVSKYNSTAIRMLRELDQTQINIGAQIEELPAVLQNAYAAERKRRVQTRLDGQHRLDYFVLDLSVGTLIAFAPEPRLGRPPDH